MLLTGVRWSFPIGRVSGITIRLHLTFLALLAVVGYSTYREMNLTVALWTVGFVCAVFGCIALHELGHSLIAQQLGVEVRSITLLPIGGVAALKRIPENPWHEIAITLAGPMVNAVIALLLLPVVGLPEQLFLVYAPTGLHAFLISLLKANVTLFLFNFLPAFPMDGGRLLRAVLALVLPYRRATTIAAWVGQGLAILFVMIGLSGHELVAGLTPLWLLLIGGFIFFGAETEERNVRTRHALGDRLVADLMNPHCARLAPGDSCEHAARLIYQTGQDDFPVVAGDRLVGIVTRQHILKSAGPVSGILEIDFPVAYAQERVVKIYDEILAEGWRAIPVLDDGRLVGWLTTDSINRFVVVQRVVAGRKPTPPPVIATVHPIAPPPPPAEPAPPTAPV